MKVLEKNQKLQQKPADQARIEGRERAKQQALEAKAAAKAEKVAAREARIPLKKRVANLVTRVTGKTKTSWKSAREEFRVFLREKVAYMFVRTSTSLYLDDSNIKLLVAKKHRIEKWFVMHLKEGLVQDGVILNPEEVAVGMDALLQQANLKNRKRIKVCLTGLSCLTKVITMPTVPNPVMNEAIKREAERELPLPLEEVYLSWQVIEASAQESRVYVIAQNRMVVDALVETLRKAMIKPYYLGLAPLALARIVNKKDCMIVDVEPGEADLVIVENGIPALIRGLPFSRDESLGEKLPVLLEEMKRNLKFYSAKARGQGTTSGLPVFITGNFDGNGSLVDSISRELKLEASPVTARIDHPEWFEASGYMANIGMAVDGAASNGRIDAATPIDVNLLPRIYRVYRPSSALLGLITAGIVLFALLGFVGFQTVNVMGDIKLKQAELEAASLSLQQATSLRGQQALEIQELRSNITDSQKLNASLAATLLMLEDRSAGIAETIATIVEDVNTEGRLETIVYSDGSALMLSGTAIDEEDVLSYIGELGQTYQSSHVNLLSMTRNGDDMVEFTLNIDIGE